MYDMGLLDNVLRRLAAAEADPVATRLRERVPDITSEIELRLVWRAWRQATLAAVLRRRADVPPTRRDDDTG